MDSPCTMEPTRCRSWSYTAGLNTRKVPLSFTSSAMTLWATPPWIFPIDVYKRQPLALEKAQGFEADPKYAQYATMMVKTHLSLSHEPTWKGVPKGWRLPIRDILEYGGAQFLCPMAGAISMMPGTGSDPAYRRVDVDTATGQVTGLF